MAEQTEDKTSKPEDQTREFLLKEYDAAKELTFHVDELRARLTSYFIALAGLALTALSVLFSAGEKPNNDEGLIRWTVAFAFIGVGLVGFIVVLIIARLRSVQLEAFRIMNNIREHFLEHDDSLWKVVELSRASLPKVRRTSGSYFWVAAIVLLSAVGIGVGAYTMWTPITETLGKCRGIVAACALGGVYVVILDQFYIHLAKPPSPREYAGRP